MWKISKEDAVQAAVARQRELSAAIDELGQFEEVVYKQHLSISLDPSKSKDTSSSLQAVKESVDSWAERVREQLAHVDCLCAEQADSLPPEQFALLRQQREQLAANYDVTVRNVELVYARLDEMTRLLIEFSSETSSAQSWITDATRRAGDIRMASLQSQNLAAERERTKALQEEVSEGDARLKRIANIVSKIDAEMSLMLETIPSIQLAGMNSDEVTRALYRVQDDYDELLKLLQDLTAFQVKLGGLHSDVTEHSETAHFWLSQLEHKVADLGEKNAGAEEKIGAAEQLRLTVAGEQYRLEHAEEAEQKLLGVLEGTPASEETKRKLERDRSERRKRHEKLLERIQETVNEAEAEKARQAGLKSAVESLCDWTAAWEKKLGELPDMPLKEDDLSNLKVEQQTLRAEADAKIALIDQLADQVKDVDVANQAELNAMLATAQRRLSKGNVVLRGYGDNLNDALNGVKELSLACDDVDKACDQLSSQIAQTAPQDSDRIAAAVSTMQSIGARMANAEQLANRLFSIPGVTDVDQWDARMSRTGEKVDSVAEQLDLKKQAGEGVEKMEQQVDADRAKLTEWLEAAEKRLSEFAPTACTSAQLEKQIDESRGVKEELQTGAALLKELEELTEQIALATQTPGSRASVIPRNVVDLAARFNRVDAAVGDRNAHLVDKYKKVVDFEADAENMKDTVAQLNAKVSGLPIDATKEGLHSAQAAIEGVEKQVRADQRKLQQLKIEASDIVRHSSNGAPEVVEKEREIETEWEHLQSDIDRAKKDIVLADKLADGATQHERWLAGKQQLLDAIGKPSTDPAAARAQAGQIHMIKIDAENEEPNLARLESLAGEIANRISNEEDKEKLLGKVSNLRRRYASFDDDVRNKEADLDKAAKLGAEISKLGKKIKHELGDLEQKVETASRLPPSEVDEQLQTLERLLDDTGRVNDLVDELTAAAKEAEELGVDDGCRRDIDEALIKAKNRGRELEKKVASVKAASQNAREKGEAVEHALDRLLMAVDDAALFVNSAPPLCADPSKIEEQSAEFEKFYGDLLAKEGEVSLVRGKFADIRMSNPKPELVEKFDRLNAAWTPLLQKTKEMKNTLDGVKDLVGQFVDAEEELKKEVTAHEGNLQKAVEGGSNAEQLADLLHANDAREKKSDALNALARRIEELAPGPDSRHLKRRAENLHDDLSLHGKKAKAAVERAKRKTDVGAKLARQLDTAEDGLKEKAGLVEQLSADKQLSRDKLKSKQWELESWRDRTERDLNQLIDELVECGDEAEAAKTTERKESIMDECDALLEELRKVDDKLQKDAEESGQMKSQGDSLSQKAHTLFTDIIDMDPVGLSTTELEKQKSEVASLEETLDDCSRELDALREDWEQAAAGKCTPIQHAGALQQIADARRVIDKGRKKLGDRKKRISTAEAERDKLCKDAVDVLEEVTNVSSSDVLQPGSDLTAAQQAQALTDVKEKMRVIGAKVDGLNSDCKAVIRGAAPGADSSQVADVAAEVSGAWTALQNAVAVKQNEIDAAVQQMGSYQDAYKSLLNWLEETEELISNQKPPSSDSNVARAQLQGYDVILKHIEDKQTSVDGFSSMMDKLSEVTSSEAEKKSLHGKADQISTRYNELLGDAQRKQARLRDTVDLAEKFANAIEPVETWIADADKRLVRLGKLPTSSEKLNLQLADVAALLEELQNKDAELDAMSQAGNALAAVAGVGDSSAVQQRLTSAITKHDQLEKRAEQCKQCLADMAEQVADFEQDANFLAQWLDQMEHDMMSVEELPINPEELLEQTNLLSELVEAVTERDLLVSNIGAVGKTLCSATSAQEALELQNKVEGLKTRYMDLAAYADEKLVLLTKAIPLSERFHDGIEAVMEWVEAVEDDLRAIDSVDLDTQQQLISAIEEDVTQWRPEVDELVAVSSQLQQLAGAERADELHQHTHEMSRRVAQIADQIGRRAERLQMTERQSRDVVDELDFVLEWLGDARERIMQAPPLAIHPEYLKTQLRNQKLLNEDLGIQKARLRDATAECRKVARQIGSGGGHDTALLQKAEVARELVDEVASMCADRTEMLEQGVVLAEQIGASFEDMNEWLQEVEDELAVQPPVTTATPPNQLAQQQQHNMELSAVIAAQRPLIERFQKDVSALVQLVEQEDAACLDQISEQIVGRFHDIQDMVKARGEGIDSILDATEAFGDRLEVLLVSLEGAAESLRQPAAVSADPGLLQSRIAENEALVDSLREKGDALNAMKERAANLLRDATPGDPAAAEVAAKVQALGQLWDEITEGAQMRGMLLNDALAKANRFWSELEGCQKALDTLKAKLDSVEPAIGQPDRIGEQKRELEDIGEEVDRTVPMINGLKHASAQLSAVIPPEEKPAVEQQVDLINQGWETITQLFADKNHNLGRAMDEAMQFHDDLSALHEYLEGAEATLNAIPDPQGETVESVRPVLEKLCAFRAEIDDHALLKEQLNQKASALTAGCTPHQTAAVRAPVAQLNQRWNDLYAAISQKEHKMERALMEMGRLGEAIDQLISWETRTEETIGELSASTPTNLRQIEILQCKVAVVANDVHAHESSVQSVNAAAARLLKKEGAEAQGGTQAQLAILNSKWKLINDSLAGITHKLDGAKSAAEDVGGEMERWLAYVEDAEAQLATVKPSGGLPETAQTHLDDFHVLKAEIEQNTPALEAHLRTTEQYLAEHAGDEGSWIGRSEQALRQKWKRCKDLVVDREKKLVLALEEAIQLERSMRETGDWLELVEDALGTAPPIGRLPDTLKTQKEQHAGLAEEVQQRKALVSEMQSTGTRMQYYCEKKDAIPIKNGLVSLRHRFEKVVARVNERGKHLDAAASETDQWLNGWSELTFWLDEAGLRQGADLHDGQSVKQHLDDAKALLDEMHSKNPLLDQTLKRGKALSEHAPKGERKQIEAKNNELRDRWRELEKTVADTKRQAEDAVLESSAFGDATAELEAWIDAELLDAEAAEDSQTRVYGDIDTVHGLVENEKKRAAERAVKKRGLDKVLEKAAELLSKDVDEKDDVEASKKRLEDKWQRVEHAAQARDAIIKDAVDKAETFDHKAHALLDWLAQKEREINKAAQTPDVDSAIAGIGEVQKALAAERPRRDDALALGSELLEKAHPLAEQPLKHWNRVVAARWKEVEERAAEKVSGLSEAKAAREERDAAIRELLAFVAQKRDELNAMTSAPVPDNLTAVADLQRQFEQLDFDLTERQPDVDKVIRGANAKKDKHTKAGELADQWKQLWLDAIGHKNALDDAKDVLEEMKRLEGWTWEDWKERYVEWNDHGKARVTDLFRRIDRSGAGNVPTPVFIDAVINSKFPTSRLEMQKVAALFDKDGFVNSKDFINALRFDKSRKPEPKTEQEKINEEMSRQVKQCSCCSAYKIEKVSDGHYRFGDTQIKRMVRILRSTVMVRVGGGWEALDEFLQKHDPCRAKGRLNINMFYNDVRPLNAVDTMRAFTKGRHSKVPPAGTPGPVMKIREKTERSMPMFPGASSSRLPVRSPSDASLSGKGTVSQSGSRASLLDGGSRPPSRASESTPERQTRIPSLRGKKGARYNPPRQL